MKRELIYSSEYLSFINEASDRLQEKLKYAATILESLENNDNINLSTRILFLNGFIKKSTKDYKREINKAETILRRLL